MKILCFSHVGPKMGMVFLGLLLMGGCVSEDSTPLPGTQYASLSSHQIVPSVPELAAGGLGVLTVDPVTRAVSGSVRVVGMVPQSVSVFDGSRGGSAGMVSLPLQLSTAGFWVVPTSTVFSVRVQQDFQNGDLYFEAVDTTNRIRGQIDQAAKQATLTSAQVEPAFGSSAGGGAGILVVDSVTHVANGSVTTTGTFTASTVGIHMAPRGQSGIEIIPLTQDPFSPGLWLVPGNTVLDTSSGANEYAAFLANGLYFNATFPDGDSRGEVE